MIPPPALPWLLLAAAFLSGPARAGEPVPPRPADQRDFEDSPNGCGPASLLNLLRFGGPEYGPVLASLVGNSDGVRMRFLVDRYFRHRPSVVHAGRMRWGVHGIEGEDFVAGINELLAESGLAGLSATYLDRREKESETEHLGRVHRLLRDSLEAGTPPLLSLRSFVVKRRERNRNQPHWETAVSHYLLVTSLSGEPSGPGFEVEAVDPWGGNRTVIYLHREANGRAFRALKGNEESGTWLDGRPFLQVLAPGVPTLRPANLDWEDRYLVVASFLIGRF